MEKNVMIFLSLLCFASIFFSCQAVAPVNKGPFVPLVGIPKAGAISYCRGSPSVPILQSPFLRGKKHFLFGKGFYGGPNFPGRYYQTWYNNHYHVPYNFNKGIQFGRGPINIPYYLLDENQYLYNGINSFIPRDTRIEYPIAGNGNQNIFDYDGNFLPIYNFDDQYDQVNSFNQQCPFNGDSCFSEGPYDGKEKVIFHGNDIVKQDESLYKGHAEGVIVIKEPNTVLDGISNSAPEKADLAAETTNVIEKSIISQNVIAHTAKGGSTNDGYVIKEGGVIDNGFNNEGGFVFDGSGLEEGILSKDEGTYYSINPNLTLHSILDGKLIKINHDISQQTDDGGINQILNFDGNKMTKYYIVKGSTQEASKDFHANRSVFLPFYGGNSAYGDSGSYIGIGIGQTTGFNGGGFNNGGAIGGEAGFSSGTTVGVGGGIQNEADVEAGVYESGSVNEAVIIGTGRGINVGILTSGGVSVSGQVSRGGTGSKGGYSSIGEKASVSGGVDIGSGAGYGRGIGFGGVPSFGGGVGLGGVPDISEASINSTAGFNGGSYQVPSQMNYIYRKAL